MNTPDNLRYKEDISAFLPLQNAAKSDKLRLKLSSHMHNGTGKALQINPGLLSVVVSISIILPGLGPQAK